MKDNTTEEKKEFKGASNLEAILKAMQDKKDEVTPAPKKPIEIPEPNDEPLPIGKEIIKEVIEEKQTAPPAPAPTPQASTETAAYKKALTLIDLGMLEDFALQLSDDDDNPTNISDFTDMSEDNLKEIVKIYKDSKKEDITTNYISKDGLQEHQLKVIDFLKNGGNIKDIAQDEDAAFKRPFDGMELDEVSHQEEILRTDLKYNKKLKDDRIDRHIKIAKEEGTLKEEAKEVFDSYRRMHSEYIDDMLASQKKDKEIKELNRKENRKALKEKMKSAGLKEDVYNKVYSEYGKVNEKGESVLIDKLREVLDNPEENFELILHLTDPKMFQDVYKIKSSNETQKAIVRLATSSVAKGNRKSTKVESLSDDAPWLKRAAAYKV